MPPALLASASAWLGVFRRFFEQVVDLCQEAGLVWGKEVLADATRVPGNASLDSLVPRLSEVVDNHLVAVFGDTAPADAIEATGDDPGRWNLLEECRLDPSRPPSGPHHRLSDRKVSRKILQVKKRAILKSMIQALIIVQKEMLKVQALREMTGSTGGHSVNYFFLFR